MNNTRYKTIGLTIKNIRLNLNKTIKEMASELGIRPFELNDIELGNRLPSIELVTLIGDKYHINVESIITAINKSDKRFQCIDTSVAKTTLCYTKDRNPFRK